MESLSIDRLFNHHAHDLNNRLGESLKGHCLFISSSMMYPLDRNFRVALEAIRESSKSDNPSDHLIIVLETNGGSIEIVERMVSVMRNHYNEVSFIVPSHAYSAGTVLVLSGDKIYMDYYSVLGPIDPQVSDESGRSLLPGAGYLAKFNELSKQINEDLTQSKAAEMNYLIKKFDPAKLFHIEQAIKHGRSLIKAWLPKYKFKDWNETENAKKAVTFKDKEERADKIATILGDAQQWHSHGRGITMEELTKDEINLKIDDFGENNDLALSIRHYHGLCVDYARKSKLGNFIHSVHGMKNALA